MIVTLAKWKFYAKEFRFVDKLEKFVGLKSKMHFMLSDDGKESNTTKGINTATGFNVFKYTSFNKK